MKLRIRGNSLRMRLSQTEVNEIASGGLCADAIAFPNKSLGYTLGNSPDNTFDVVYQQDEIKVMVPSSTLSHWATTETEVGIEHHLPLSGGDTLYLLIEKDFACLAERPNEDESDNFPNPLAEQGKSC